MGMWQKLLEAAYDGAPLEDMQRIAGIPERLILAEPTARLVMSAGTMVGGIKPFKPYDAVVRLKDTGWSAKELAKLPSRRLEELFPYTKDVMKQVSEGIESTDGIRGLNKGHALWKAKQNWPGLEAEVVGREHPNWTELLENYWKK